MFESACETAAPALPGTLEQCHARLQDQDARLQYQDARLQDQDARLQDQDARLQDLETLIDELQATVRLQEREKEQLLHRVEYLIGQLYGRRSEKIDPAQLLLFAEEAMAAAQTAVEPEAAKEEEPEASSAPKRKGHGRKRPPASLPHLPVEHDVSEADKVCAQCGGEKRRIGEKVTEQLEYAPASLFVIDHIQPVYACPCCQEGVVVAPKPAQPIEKGLAGPGLLAQVVVSKYCDHLPLYRQEDLFARHGLEISRQTLWGWVYASAQVLEPVASAMKELVLASKVIHTDDTPIDVRGKTRQCQGRFWVYLGDALHPYTVYDFTPNRRRDGPVEFLRGFTGDNLSPRYLQADAYGGYDGIYTADNGVLECACWAHARRKFHEARTSDVNRAHRMLAWIKQLYDIEREGKELDAAQRCALRQARAVPLLDAMRQWLDEQQGRALPKNPISEAITYARNQWEALVRYTVDGDLAIDNNAAENALRGIAIGRKNYLFIASEKGGRAAAILYSLIQSAKRHALDPFVYLRDLFLRIPTHPNKDLHLLLPDHWKREILPTLEGSPRL